jgi:hypothetical protein
MTALRLEIDIEGPVVTAGLATPAYGVDTGFMRDPDGNFILPGTLVKGVVVHMLSLISTAAPDRLAESTRIGWFGQGTDDARNLDDGPAQGGRGFEPCRGIVHFGDFRLVEEKAAEKAARLTRIAVDDATGSVRRGMLQLLESPLDYGEPGTFAGTLTVAGSAAEAEQIAVWVRRALELWPAIGAAKSAGFGRITAVRCEPQNEPRIAGRLASDAAACDADRVGYALEFPFADPLLVASQAISGNLFKSSEEIPGGVVKGALARAIAAAGRMTALEQALDRMIIRHAKPVLLTDGLAPPYKRPGAIPLSLFSVETFEKDDFKLDFLLDASNEGEKPEEYAEHLKGIITFQPDWKDGGKARCEARRELQHTAKFRRDVRTRTAIDDKKGTAQTSQLFSRIALDTRGHLWVGELAVGEAEPDAFREILDIMQRGLAGIGKTGARAAVAFFKPAPRTVTRLDNATPGCCRWRILLETDALLHGPDAVFAHPELGLDPEARLEAQYRDYFAEAINNRLKNADPVTPGDLHLRFFAQQRWAGGYQALRFPAKSDGTYYPHLVTVAGSLFVLDAPKRAAPAIESFVARGLPLPEGVPKSQFEHQRSPFVPQNGYGEVSIGDYFVWKKNA